MSDLHLVSLYTEYYRPIKVRCRRILADTAAAEDATQETFLRVALELRRLPGTEATFPWLYRIATNVCLNELRSRRRRPGAGPAAALDSSVGLGEQALVHRNLTQVLGSRIPAHLRVPAWLHYVAGMSHAELATATGMSRRTVINYIAEFSRRARRVLETDAPRIPLPDSLPTSVGAGVLGAQDRSQTEKETAS
jgi:RNA polymerase sigma-70 factor (ECF subfamily)